MSPKLTNFSIDKIEVHVQQSITKSFVEFDNHFWIEIVWKWTFKTQVHGFYFGHLLLGVINMRIVFGYASSNLHNCLLTINYVVDLAKCVCLLVDLKSLLFQHNLFMLQQRRWLKMYFIDYKCLFLHYRCVGSLTWLFCFAIIDGHFITLWWFFFVWIENQKFWLFFSLSWN